MTNAPLISIGLPVYNGQNFIANAIECVQAQTIADWELLISDNNSSDETVRICQQFAASDPRIKIHRSSRNMGVTPNYNRVFHYSQGHYFKWITHDDLFLPTFVQDCIEELERDRNAVLVFPRLGFRDERRHGSLRSQQTSDLSVVGATAASRVKALMRLEALNDEIFWSLYGVVRRSTLEDTGLMGPYSGSDQVLLLQIALKGDMKQLQKDLFVRREHPAASTLRRGWTARERAKFACANDSRRAVFPYCRMLMEHVACIRHSSLSITDKSVCFAAVLGRFLRQWRYFAHELVASPLETLSGR